MGQQSLSEEEVNTQSDGHHVCIVCFGNLELNMRAKLPCGHDDMCGICHLRLRFLHDDKKCPICKQVNDTIIVDSDDSKTFDSYPRWGDEIGAGFVYKADVGMFFEENYYKKAVVPLFEFSCRKCKFAVDENIFINQHLETDDGEEEDNNDGNNSNNQNNNNNNSNNSNNNNKNGGNKRKKKPLKLLQDHLRKKHRLSMCQLCIDHKRDFVSQLPRFTHNQLQNHMKNGDGPGSGFSGHPICEFCRPKRFYDVNFLHQHLHKEHYKCHVCEKQGLDNQWFKNYNSLARHFDKHHFMCHHPQCQAARFVVFENELDLRAHEINVHGGTSTGSTKINLEFNIRRGNDRGSERQNAPSEADFNYNLDGQAFVPPALANDINNANSNENANGGGNRSSREPALHPQHVQRTEELRAQAAVLRQQQALESREESFPTLQTAVGPSSAPMIGWTSGTTLQNVNRSNRNIGEITQEAFPSLQPSAPSSSNRSNPKKAKASRGTIGATRRQFAAMTTSSNQQPTSWSGNSAAVGSASAAPPPSAYGNFLVSPTSARQVNRQTHLTPDNFPSLGNPSPASTHAAASAPARRNYAAPQRMAPPPSLNSTADFPSIQSGTASATTTVARAAKKKPPPSINSASDFPAPPSVRDRMLGEASDRKPLARDNVLRASSSSSSVTSSDAATVEDMKASLGQKNFKQLKKLTKAFALDELAPEGYVDQSAALFETGYDDPDFWNYLPSLLKSCPNSSSAQRAIKYMNSLKRQQNAYATDQAQPSSAFVAASAARGTPKSSQWNGAVSAGIARQVVPPPRPVAPAAPRSLTQQLGVTRPQAATTISSKKKGAWGAGGKATIVRTKAPPGSVGAAAAVQGPQGGSATKFMATEQKQKKQQAKNAAAAANGNNNQQQNKAKKKKQKNELRDLAFGK
mmetsp:Transcript_22712/g.53650  ORF Transcript_22712/g.53650 Transcript_22712/m.53650 type:complete len:917 (+) Transcript_22712:210-2960(+)